MKARLRKLFQIPSSRSLYFSGPLLGLAYGLIILPLGYLYFNTEIFFVMVLSVPMFLMILSGIIADLGFKKESLLSMLSMILSPLIFLIGIVLSRQTSIVAILGDIMVWTSILTFLGVPSLLILASLIRNIIEEEF